MTTVVISQPMYFPWVGFVAQMSMADVFIWLDDVQFSKGSFTNRVQVKMPSGRKWMTVPLERTGSFQRISELVPKGENWRQSHRQMLVSSFLGCPHAPEALQLFDEVVATPDSFCDQMIASAEAEARAMSCLPPKILRASSMAIDGSSTGRVLKLVKEVGGDHYITGHGAYAYLDHEAMNQAGVAVSYMDYTPRPWPQDQDHGGFTPFVTGLDLLAAEGLASADHLCPATVDWRAFRTTKDKNE